MKHAKSSCDLWVNVLEKAWAQLHEGVQMRCDHIFRAVTGAPSYCYLTSEEGVWEQIRDGHQHGYLMCVSQKDNGHIYPIIQALEQKTDGVH